jgi:HNH endonuclease
MIKKFIFDATLSAPHFPLTLSPLMTEIELSRQLLDTLNKESDTFKTLNAMLNGMNGDTEGDDQTGFQHVRLQVAKEIVKSDNMNELAAQCDEFLARMIAKGGVTSGSGPSSPTGSRKSQGLRNSDPDFRHSVSRNGTKYNIPIRDGNTCVLTGLSDLKAIPGTNGKQGFQAAHMTPHSLLKYPTIHGFIKSLIPWLPQDFFQNIDSCQNSIFLNNNAHISFGSFEWFVVMDEHEDPTCSVYRASQVQDNGLLQLNNFGRDPITIHNGSAKKTSSFNQQLFIGVHPTFPRPTKFFCRLHELVARILAMRGGAEVYKDFEDEDEYTDPIKYSEAPMPFEEKVDYLMFNNTAGTLFNEPITDL